MNIKKFKFVSFHPLLHLALAAGNTKEILKRRQQQVGRSVKSFVGKFRNDQHWVRPDAYKIFPCGKYYSNIIAQTL